MPIIEEVSNVPGLFLVECPGCKMLHQIHTVKSNPKGPSWTFNNNMNAPTFSPSLMVKYTWGEEQKERICHSFIRDGVWEFLNDCTHELAGKKVPMIEVD